MKIKSPILLFVVLMAVFSFSGCSEDGQLPGTYINVEGEWYMDGGRLTFLANGEYQVSGLFLGVYEITETGTWSFDDDTNELTATVVINGDGSWGLGEYVGDRLVVTVESQSETALVFATDDGLIALTNQSISFPTGTISDSFGGSSINQSLWYKDLDSGSSIYSQNNQAHFSADNGKSAKLKLYSGGYSQLETTLTVTSGSHGAGGSSLELGWYPFGEEYVILGIQAGLGGAGDFHITSSVENAGYTLHGQAALGQSFHLKMTWNGSTVGFYINGTLVNSYSPPSNRIIFSHTVSPRIKAYTSEGSYIAGYADNFVATP